MSVIDVHTYLEGYVLPGVNQSSAQIAPLMQARGIERSVLFSARAAQVDPLSGNRILKAMVEQGTGLYGCLTVHLNRVDASLQAIRDLLGGKRFVGTYVAPSDPNNPHEPLHPIIADEVLNACRRFQKPIFLPTPDANGIEVALHLAKTYTQHKFVFVGMGGSDWRTAIAAAHQAVNINLETSGPLDRHKIPAAIEVIGSHRILFGSGSPHVDPAAALGLLADSEISSADRKRLLFDNAYRLFRLDEIEGA